MSEFALPAGLPVPEDDGAADHLEGASLPSVSVPVTGGTEVDLGDSAHEFLAVYAFPRAGRPGEALPAGWDEIPGARGCTPQSCAFRDLHGEIAASGAIVLGLSSQTIEEQRDLATRLGLHYPLASDPRFAVADALRLPTFEVAEVGRLYRRLTFIARRGVIEKVFYPVFPPDRNAEEVLAWLTRHK